MPTFTYAPGVKVYIDSQDKGLLDVSEDLIEGTMERRSDGVSTFQFALQNNQRKYDQIFAPNDRIVVMMKRVTWLRVFTGYLNSVPLLTAWPSNVNISASCSLKRLQYWYWDQYAPYTNELIRSSLRLGDRGAGDGGATTVALRVLNDVVGWPNNKVHIGKIPEQWLEWALEIAKYVQAEAGPGTEGNNLDTVFGNGTGTSGAGGSVPTGKYGTVRGGYNFGAQEVKCANAIYRVGVSLNKSLNEMAWAVYVGICETNLDSTYAKASGPSKGYGMFSQLSPSSLATDIDRSVRVLFDNYDRKKPSDNINDTKNWYKIAKKVQGFSDNGQYQEPSNNSLPNQLFVSAAVAVIAEANQTQAPLPSGAVSGAAIVNQASVLLSQNIPYTHWRGNISKASIATLKQKGIDCSGLVYWVFEQVLGHGKTPFVATVENAGSKSIYQYCQKNGRVVAAPASADDPLYKIPGALLFVINRGGGSDDHVGIALGDGTKNAIQARRPGKPASVTTDNWEYIGFPDKLVDYSAQGGASGTGNSAVAPSTPESTPSVPPYELDPTDPFNQLFGTQYFPSQLDADSFTLAEGLTGIRALMNDQPILPYLKNLMASTMRSYCSAPNGDFIAWFPDYYGIWGTAAIMTIQPIELQDFQVIWSDDFFVTHQYTVAGRYNNLNTQTGTVEGYSALTRSADIRTQTLGIATIEIPAIMKSLFGIDIDDGTFTEYIFNRFGARPDFQFADGLVGPKAEFFSALYFFMRQWVYQYNAEIPLTFMPELYPGMLIQIPYLDFQAYVTTVSHSFQFGRGGGFSTAINIAAPARIPTSEGDKSHSLEFGLPSFGGVFVPTSPKYNTNGVNSFEDSRIADIPLAGLDGIAGF